MALPPPPETAPASPGGPQAPGTNTGPQLEPFDPTAVVGTVPAWEGKINDLNGQADSAAAGFLGKIPGFSDPAKLVKDTLKKEGSKHVDSLKEEIMGIITLMNTPEALTDDDIPKINATIRKINAIILSIESGLETLNSFAKTIFPIILIISVAYTVAKIITLLPVVGAGMGAVISFPQPNHIAQLICSVCSVVLEILKPIAFAIVAIMWMLIEILKLLNMIIGFLISSLDIQNDLLNDAIADSLKSADDWANTGDVGDDSLALSVANTNNLNDDGSAGNLSERLDLMRQINDIDSGNTGNEDDFGDLSGNDGGISTINDGVCGTAPGCENLSYAECLNSTDCSWDSGGIGNGPAGPPPSPPSPYCNDNGECWIWVDEFGWSTTDGTTGGTTDGTTDGTTGGTTGGWLSAPPSGQPPNPPSPYCYPGTNPLVCYEWRDDPPPGGWYLLELVACTLPSGEVQQLSPEACLLAGGEYGGLVACLLPDGTLQHMTPEDCMVAGGTYGNLNLVSCLLPDGSISQMTPAACLSNGGMFGGDLSSYRDDLEDRLNSLGGGVDGATGGVCGTGPECENLSYEECLNSTDCSWSAAGDLIITSVINLHKDVTVEKATNKRGKRYGFYQSDIKKNK